MSPFMMGNSRATLLLTAFSFLLVSCISGVRLNSSHGNILPQTVVGDAAALRGSMIEHDNGKSRVQGYFIAPRTHLSHGSAVLLHDKNGLSERIKQTADDLAAEGYSIFAIDLFDEANLKKSKTPSTPLDKTLPKKNEVFLKINQAIEYLRARRQSNGKIALIGWSLGGTIALDYALNVQNNDGTAVFFADLPDNLDAFYRMRHELYGTFAESPELQKRKIFKQVAYIQRAIGSYSDLYIYEDVDPEFWLYVDKNTSRNRLAAEDAWLRLKGYLLRTINSEGGLYEQKKY